MPLLVEEFRFLLAWFQSQLATFRASLSVTNLPVVAFEVANDFTKVPGLGSLGHTEVVEVIDTRTTTLSVNRL